MSDCPPRIVAADQLVSWFGYWPSFHDAEILWIKLKRGYKKLQGDVEVEFLVHTWELVSVDNQLRSEKHCLIHFAFQHCAAIRLEGFNQQNQLSTIEFILEKQILPTSKVVPSNAVVQIKDHNQVMAEEVLVVNFVSEFGLSGGFKCYQGEVVSIRACNNDGMPFDEKLN
jgi:hypothetical protein